MKTSLGMFAGSALIAAQMAIAQSTPAVAAPQVAGKYAVVDVTNCEAAITFGKNGSGDITNINLVQPGKISVSTGYITFTPATAGATNGQATVSGQFHIAGGSLRINSNGTAMGTQASSNQTGAYSLTATSFAFAGTVFRMTFADIVGGVSHSLNFVHQTTNENKNRNCLETITVTKQ
ncbi:MAG: hypothetical protein ACRECC_01250 [Pseudolabrys sp.]